jgi:hypothetical protein
MPVDHGFQRLQPVGDESPIAAGAEIGGEGLEEPQRGVDRVVLWTLAAVGKAIGKQTLVQIPDVGAW